MPHPPAYPHDPIEPIGQNVFLVRGEIPVNPLVRVSRNMAIVREGEELTLVNPLRLGDAELARLDALGRVKHVLRLGAMHGLDDPFYVDRYGATFWSQEGGTIYTEPKIDRALVEGGPLPFSGARLLCFRKTNEPEAAILLERERLLLVTDAIQHYGDFSHNNLPARLLMPLLGFSKTTLVGPLWLKLMTPEGQSLRDDLERLLELDFDKLLSAHGTLLAQDAHSAVETAIARAFARKKR